MAACFWHPNQSEKLFVRSSSMILFALLSLSLSMLHAQSLKYKALLIGNDAYVNFPRLEGAPIKDVDAMYQVLIGLGLAEGSITVVKDLDHSEFLTALLDFRAKLKADDAVLFYYSGHGFSIDGDDYLAPVDFSFGETRDETQRKSIGVAQVVAYLATIKSRVIVLDACRTDAPRLKQMAANAPKIALDPLISSRSSGSLIAYSTSAQKASNARSPSGLSFYTQYLVNSLAARPRDMYTALNNAKSATSSASEGRQVPAIYDEMEGSFIFLNEKLPPTSLTKGVWTGFPNPQALEFGPNDGCRWRLQIAAPAVKLDVNDQGQISSGTVSYTYNETWIDQERMRARGIDCHTDVPVDSDNVLSLSSVKTFNGSIRIVFSGKGTTKPEAMATFDGKPDIASSLITGNLNVIRTDLTSREAAWIWNINMPVAIGPESPMEATPAPASSSAPAPSESAPISSAPPAPRPPVKRIGQLEVTLSGCRSDPEGLICSALVTNLGAERQYCLASKADTMMSRIVDAQGAVSTPLEISLAEQRGTFQMWECASLPSGVPVAASLHFKIWTGFSTRIPGLGERLNLVEFGFDLINYTSKSPTSMFAQFHDVPVTR